jgi:putative transposase
MENVLYPSDLTDAEWSFLEPLVPPPKSGGRPASWSRRAILNAIFYLVRGGCAWRLLPREYPPWQTVYGYFRAWKEDGIWDSINTALREQVRVAAGRHSTLLGDTAPRPQPSWIHNQVRPQKKGASWL